MAKQIINYQTKLYDFSLFTISCNLNLISILGANLPINTCPQCKVSSNKLYPYKSKTIFSCSIKECRKEISTKQIKSEFKNYPNMNFFDYRINSLKMVIPLVGLYGLFAVFQLGYYVAFQ